MNLLLRLRRAAYHRRALPTELRRAWDAQLPAASTPAEELRFLVCDGEMTGLAPGRDSLLSLGWVPVDHGELLAGRARHFLLRTEGSVGQSATLHHLRDCSLREGVNADEALRGLLRDAVGRILVFHNARLDSAFLDVTAQQAWGVPLLLPTVDTLLIEERRLRRRDRPPREGELQLRACRARYGLPPHRPHCAVADAIATGELLLAQIAHRGPGISLGNLR